MAYRGLNIHCDPDVTLDQVQRNLTPSFESEDWAAHVKKMHCLENLEVRYDIVQI